MKPGFEPVRVAHRPDVQPGRHQGVLDGVTGEVVVTKDQPRRPMQSRDGTSRQGREGLVVAGLRADDQVTLHLVDGLVQCGRVAASPMMGRTRRDSFHLRHRQVHEESPWSSTTSS